MRCSRDALNLESFFEAIFHTDRSKYRIHKTTKNRNENARYELKSFSRNFNKNAKNSSNYCVKAFYTNFVF